jgi:hypothetical protein
VEDAADGSSKMTFDFVAAKHGKVLDTITLTNTLRREHRCHFCYSYTGGRVPSCTHVQPECSPPENTADLEKLFLERQDAEGVEWRAPDADALADILLVDALTNGEEQQSGGESLDDLRVEDVLDEQDMNGAAKEMDAQSDDGEGPEGPGFTRKYSSVKARAFT